MLCSSRDAFFLPSFSYDFMQLQIKCAGHSITVQGLASCWLVVVPRKALMSTLPSPVGTCVFFVTGWAEEVGFFEAVLNG